MQKFSYTPSNPFCGSVSSLAIGAGMVVVPLVYPFGIRIGRMRILGPTAVTIIFVIGGLALLAFTVRLRGQFPALNEEDIRYCCMVRMHLSLAEIASVVCLEKDSVKKRLKRIRTEKLASAKGSTLEEILSRL